MNDFEVTATNFAKQLIQIYFQYHKDNPQEIYKLYASNAVFTLNNEQFEGNIKIFEKYKELKIEDYFISVCDIDFSANYSVTRINLSGTFILLGKKVLNFESEMYVLNDFYNYKALILKHSMNTC